MIERISRTQSDYKFHLFLSEISNTAIILNSPHFKIHVYSEKSVLLNLVNYRKTLVVGLTLSNMILFKLS